jgi:acetylornithine deacetylase
MKGSAAAALFALGTFSAADQQAPVYFFVTGDEECGMAGAAWLREQCPVYAEAVARECVAIVGEPTELQLVNTHKGACHIMVSAKGTAAHSSTREGQNANWQMIPFLTYLEQVHQRCQTEAALLNPAFDPPTLSLNCILENHPAAANITVGSSICSLFFRPMPNTDWQALADEVCNRAHEWGLSVKRLPPLPPVHTSSHRAFVQDTLSLLTQPEPLAVCYATDGCCFTDLSDLIVLGPGSIEQAHRPNEWISLEQLERGAEVFGTLFRRHCGLGEATI